MNFSKVSGSDAKLMLKQFGFQNVDSTWTTNCKLVDMLDRDFFNKNESFNFEPFAWEKNETKSTPQAREHMREQLKKVSDAFGFDLFDVRDMADLEFHWNRGAHNRLVKGNYT